MLAAQECGGREGGGWRAGGLLCNECVQYCKIIAAIRIDRVNTGSLHLASRDA